MSASGTPTIGTRLKNGMLELMGLNLKPDPTIPRPRGLRRFFPKAPAVPEGYHSGTLYRDVIALAWPALIELILTQLTSMADMMMVGGLGPWAITSVGLTTQPKFLLMTMIMSLNVGTTALVARFRGAGDQKAANDVFRQALSLTLVVSTIAAVLGYVFARPMVAFMGAQEPATLDGGTVYLRVQMIGFVPIALTSTITAAMRGAGFSRQAMYYNTASNVVNILLNYLLIEGHWGFPRLELFGASLATSIGQCVAFLIAFAIVLSKRYYIKLQRGDSFKPNFSLIRRIARVGMPALLEQGFMRAGMITFAKTVAGLGTVAFATHNICMNIQAMSFMTCTAFSTAATSLVGQSLGKKNPQLAECYCSRARRLTDHRRRADDRIRYARTRNRRALQRRAGDCRAGLTDSADACGDAAAAVVAVHHRRRAQRRGRYALPRIRVVYHGLSYTPGTYDSADSLYRPGSVRRVDRAHRRPASAFGAHLRTLRGRRVENRQGLMNGNLYPDAEKDTSGRAYVYMRIMMRNIQKAVSRPEIFVDGSRTNHSDSACIFAGIVV